MEAIEELRRIEFRDDHYVEAHSGEIISLVSAITTRTFMFTPSSIENRQIRKEAVIEDRARSSFQKRPTTPRANGYVIVSSHGDPFPTQAEVRYVKYIK